MATRLYFSTTDSVPAGITPGFGGWTRTSEGARRRMYAFKNSQAMASKTFWAAAAAGVDETCLAVQFISDPMAAGIGFVTTDTVKCVIRCAESATNDNINRAPTMLKVYSEDGTTLRATLLTLLHRGPNTTEWVVTTLTSKQLLDGDVLGANYTTVRGDRLVLEVGGQVSAAAGVSVTGTMSFGADGAADLDESEVDTGADNPWFESSRDITFLAEGWGAARASCDVQSSLPVPV